MLVLPLTSNDLVIFFAVLNARESRVVLTVDEIFFLERVRAPFISFNGLLFSFG